MVEVTASKPVRRRRIIERPRLTRLLDESQGRIKLLVAPAGYGKTTLARQWLADKRACWYSGTAASTDVAALAEGVQKAVAALLPGSGDALLERLPVTPRPDEEADVLARMLGADLEGWLPSDWLVLDDYQTLGAGSAAERFIEALLSAAPVNALVLTRRVPSWASARRILYGEVCQVDRSDLAMSDDEAYDVLGGTTSTVSHELVGLAQGWPAVLGLASTSGVSAPELVSAPHLYRFFADEIYRRMSRATRELLCELALYDAPSRAKFLLRQPPQLAERVVRVGIDRGFIVEASEARIEIHPLLRAFLESKLRQDAPDHVRPTVERAARDLITHGLWDDAYDLIQRFEASDLLPELIGASHAALLEVGRVATLRTWLQKAPEDASSVQLAAAELAFREGRFRESETLALLVTRKSNESPLIVAQGFIVAGRAAHAASQLEDAATYYRLAREGATSDRVIRDALFGELAAANELERTSEARKLLDALSEIGDLSPSDQVILADRRLNFESHNGIACSINDARSAWQLLPYVKDPIARSSFRNVLGYALVASCKLDEATAITAEQLEDVDRCRLDFVIPYALVIQALTSYIRHDYVSADALIDEAEDRAVAAGDRTARHIAMAARCRILNAQGAHNLTLSRPLDADVNLTPWLRAELASCHAVAFAAQGRAQQAESTAAEAEVLSLSPEVRINVACARAIAAIQGGDSRAATTHAQVALDAVGVSRVLEPFISAYRGYPSLAAALLDDPDSRDRILDILATAGDQVIADAVPDPRASSALLLSPREREVLALVSQGLSNPEIGKQLFISPVTVKVHVRHIFEKLGVHSRAQAAVRGSQLTRTHATPATRAAAGRD